jgi:hypothetical protein
VGEGLALGHQPGLGAEQRHPGEQHQAVDMDQRLGLELALGHRQEIGRHEAEHGDDQAGQRHGEIELARDVRPRTGLQSRFGHVSPPRSPEADDDTNPLARNARGTAFSSGS